MMRKRRPRGAVFYAVTLSRDAAYRHRQPVSEALCLSAAITHTSPRDACIVGGIVHATAHDTFHLPLENSAMMGMVVTLVIRLAAIRWHLKLPTFALDDNGR